MITKPITIIRQFAMGVLPLSILKQERLRIVMTLMVAMVAAQVIADSWHYNYTPSMGEYTSTGTGTTKGIYINNTNDSHSTSTKVNYSNGIIKTTVYGHNTNGMITFRVMKDDGSTYFVKNTTGKIYVYDVGSDKLYATWFSVSNSYTDHEDAQANVGNFSGTRVFQIFMIKSDGQQFYGGAITHGSYFRC